MLSQSKLWGMMLHPDKAAAVGLGVLGQSRQGASLASCSLGAQQALWHVGMLPPGASAFWGVPGQGSSSLVGCACVAHSSRQLRLLLP